MQRRLRVSRPTLDRQLTILGRDELVVLSADRRVELTRAGYAIAEVVMRRHRLVERLLVDVLKLEWEFVHPEANRWQHVLGADAELRIFHLLGGPTTSPFGNPIPALAGLTGQHHRDRYVPSAHGAGRDLRSVLQLSRSGGGRARLHHIGEGAQDDSALLRDLRRAHVSAGSAVTVGARARGDDRVRISAGGGPVAAVCGATAACLFVSTR